MRSVIVGILFGMLALAAPVDSSGATWYIKADGSGAAPTIQAGIDSSATGDSVLVAAGTYTGAGNYNIDFLGKSIAVVAESGPTVTTVDCQSNGQGFIFNNNETSSAILVGFTIANGYTTQKGGGIFCDKASPQIIDNIIIDCVALQQGGGICIKGVSTATVVNCTIVGNSAVQSGAGITTGAGATPTISNSIIAFSPQGDGVSCTGGSLPVYSCNDIFGNAGGDAVCGTDGGDNIALDPEFCGMSGTNNYYLQSDSPCAPASSPCSLRVGCLPTACATVDDEESTWGIIKAMFE